MAAETIAENYLNLWRSIDLNVENYKLFYYFFSCGHLTKLAI